MPYQRRKSKLQGCGRFFSVKTGTFMEASNLRYQAWLFALFLVATNLKSVSIMNRHGNVSVTQRTAWHMAYHIRKALASGDGNLFEGPAEMDETYMGDRRRNMSNSKRKELTGRDQGGETAVVGMRDRDTNKVSAKVVRDPTSDTLHSFGRRRVIPGTTNCTEEATAYASLPNRGVMKHSVSEYVWGRVHTNRIERFWSTLKRARKGTFPGLSPKHLHRYVDELAGRHKIRDLDVLKQMASIVADMGALQLRYRDMAA